MIGWVMMFAALVVAAFAPMWSLQRKWNREDRERQERQHWQAWRIPHRPDLRECWRWEVRQRGR